MMPSPAAAAALPVRSIFYKYVIFTIAHDGRFILLFFKPVAELRFKEAKTCLGSQGLVEAGRAPFQGSGLPPTHHPCSCCQSIQGLTCCPWEPSTYRCWRRPGSVGQGVSCAVHPPMDEIGSCAGDDGAPPDIHGDAHHTVGGDRRRRGTCHGHLGIARGLEVRCCAARGIHRRLGVIGIGRPPVRKREGTSSESWRNPAKLHVKVEAWQDWAYGVSQTTNTMQCSVQSNHL